MLVEEYWHGSEPTINRGSVITVATEGNQLLDQGWHVRHVVVVQTGGSGGEFIRVKW